MGKQIVDNWVPAVPAIMSSAEVWWGQSRSAHRSKWISDPACLGSLVGPGMTVPGMTVDTADTRKSAGLITIHPAS